MMDLLNMATGIFAFPDNIPKCVEYLTDLWERCLADFDIKYKLPQKQLYRPILFKKEGIESRDLWLTKTNFECRMVSPDINNSKNKYINQMHRIESNKTKWDSSEVRASWGSTYFAMAFRVILALLN